MVYTNQLKEEKNRIESIVSKAKPLNELVQGGFREEATYHFKGKDYHLKDLPDYVVASSSLIIELYLKLKEK